ncbi:MAG: hypothetical protein HGA44_17305 [Cellulomonadaceae bacterium]|nr:hypothetical protein [Cellulomonadaceae bacterium]
MPVVPEPRPAPLEPARVPEPRPDAVPLPAAGWYPDPHGTSPLWWTGTAWSDRDPNRPAPAQETTRRPAAAPHPEDSYLTGHAVPTPVNPPARLGLLLGIVAVVVNPVLLVGIAAVVVSAVGLQRASLMGQHGVPAVGRSRALGGLVLGLVATVFSVTVKGALF